VATRFTYFRVFAVGGLTLSDEEIPLGTIGQGVDAFMMRDPRARCSDGDRALALGELLLRGLFAPENLPSAQDRIQATIERNVQERRNKHGQGPYVVVLCTGSVDTFDPTKLKLLEDYFVGFDAVDKDAAARMRFEEPIDAILAAIALNFPSVVSFRTVLDQVVFYADDSRAMFSFTLRAGAARLRAGHAVPAQAFANIALQAGAASKGVSLRRVRDLMLRSLMVEKDRLRGFIAAWTALEVLVNKLFSLYEAELFAELARGRPHPLPEWLVQVRKTMSSKYRLYDRFVVVATALDPREAHTDAAAFMSAKKLRDSLSHGDDVSDESLPLEVVSRLLRKYFALHSSREAA
jgi:hypothetical protein